MQEITGSRKNLCSSCKTNKLLSGDQKRFNAKSRITQRMICADCDLQEFINEKLGKKS